jgi:ribokinase
MGVSVLLNPAPARHLPESIWPHLDYVVPNQREASVLTGIDVVDFPSAARAADVIRRKGARHVLITLGSAGVLVADPKGFRSHCAPAVRAVDTTAAGDTFVGALAVMLSEGADLDVAASFAVEAAAISVTRLGAQTSIPYRHEVCTPAAPERGNC